MDSTRESIIFSKFKNWFWRPSAKYAWGAILLIGMIVGVTSMTGLTAYIEYTNTLGFCISCHDMEETVFPEYQQSGHYINHEGVRVVCSDCHVPKAFLPKMLRKAASVNELYHKMIGTIDTKELFEERRLYLAEKVWASMEKSDSRECRNCHAFDAMDLGSQSDTAEGAHLAAIEGEMTCIDCHKGIAHELPDGY